VARKIKNSVGGAPAETGTETPEMRAKRLYEKYSK